MLHGFDGRWQQHPDMFDVDEKRNLAGPNYAHFPCVPHTNTHTRIYDAGFESQQEQETFLQNLQTRCGAQPLSHLMGTGVISWRSRSRGVKFSTLFHVAQRLRLHLYAFMTYTGAPLAVFTCDYVKTRCIFDES